MLVRKVFFFPFFCFGLFISLAEKEIVINSTEKRVEKRERSEYSATEEEEEALPHSVQASAQKVGAKMAKK